MGEFQNHYDRYLNEGIDYIRDLPRIKDIENKLQAAFIGYIDHSENKSLILRYSAVAPQFFPDVKKSVVGFGICTSSNIFESQSAEGNHVYRMLLFFYHGALGVHMEISRN